MKFALVFIGSAVVLFTFFYFYPAEIFEGTVIDANGTPTVMDLSLRSLFWGENLPSSLVVENIVKIKPTTAGWLLLGICNLGLPLMLAYRTKVDRSPRPDKNK